MDNNLDAYVNLAKTTLEMYLHEGTTPDVQSNLPDELLKDKAGVFVSLHKNGELRGCIGTIFPTCDSIAEEIIQNAVSSGTGDPRFEPVEAHELPYLDYKVDVLGKPEPISDLSELDVKRYGVIVTSGRRRGLLLPDLEGIDTPEEQVQIAMRKAGIRSGETISLERFEVVRHGEK